MGKVSDSRSRAEAPRTGWKSRILNVAFVPFAAIIGLHIIGCIFPTYHTWGFNYWNLFPKPVSLSILFAALLLVVPPVSSVLAGFFARVFSPVVRHIQKYNGVFRAVLVSALLFALLYVFRSRAHVYGDGFMVLANQIDPGKPFEFSLYFMKPLVVLFHRTAYHFLSSVIATSPENIFSMISAAGGVVGIWALYRISSLLSSDLTHRWLIFLGGLVSGSVILFFGYVENYTWATSLSLWSVAFSIGFVKRKNTHWPALITAALATGFHFVAAPFLMVAILTTLSHPDRRPAPKRLSLLRWGSWGLVVLSVGAALVVQAADLPPYVVPLWPKEQAQYWSLSLDHILDMLNELVLVAPIGAMIVLYALFWRRKETVSERPEGEVLASASLLAFVFSFWLDPELGAARDWDLLSFFGFPLALWGVYRLSRMICRPQSLHILIVPVVITGMVHVLPNLFEKNNLHVAAQRLDRILWDCPQHQVDYDKARRTMIWGTILRDEVDESELALKHFRRRLSADSTSLTSLFSIGDWFASQKEYDSAVFYLRRMAFVDPFNTGYLLKLAIVETELRNYDVAQKIMRHCVSLKPEDDRLQYAAGIIASSAGEIDQALIYYRTTFGLNPHAEDLALNMGLLYSRLKQYDSAYVYLKQACERSPRSASAYRALLTAQVALGKLDEARRTFELIQRLFPDDPVLKGLLPENRKP